MTTDRPDLGGAAGSGRAGDVADAGDGREGLDSVSRPKPRRRIRRRAERAGTNPAADEAPDVLAPRAEGSTGESQHDRWLREQRPPHWE